MSDFTQPGYQLSQLEKNEWLEYQQKWSEIALSTERCSDRTLVEGAINNIYNDARQKPPSVIWCASPWQMLTLPLLASIPGIFENRTHRALQANLRFAPWKHLWQTASEQIDRLRSIDTETWWRRTNAYPNGARGHLKTSCIMWRKQCELRMSPTILGELRELQPLPSWEARGIPHWQMNPGVKFDSRPSSFLNGFPIQGVNFDVERYLQCALLSDIRDQEVVVQELKSRNTRVSWNNLDTASISYQFGNKIFDDLAMWLAGDGHPAAKDRRMRYSIAARGITACGVSTALLLTELLPIAFVFEKLLKDDFSSNAARQLLNWVNIAHETACCAFLGDAVFVMERPLAIEQVSPSAKYKYRFGDGTTYLTEATLWIPMPQNLFKESRAAPERNTPKVMRLASINETTQRMTEASKRSHLQPSLVEQGRRIIASPKHDHLWQMKALTEAMSLIMQACVRGNLNVLVSCNNNAGKAEMVAALRACVIESGDRVIGDCASLHQAKLLQVMRNDCPGSILTVCAPSRRLGLFELEALVRKADASLSERAARELIASAINLVIQTARLTETAWRITSMSELLPQKRKELMMYESEGDYWLNPIFEFDPESGSHIGSGIPPYFFERLQQAGIPFLLYWLVGRVS
jgi:hypothetical protein